MGRTRNRTRNRKPEPPPQEPPMPFNFQPVFEQACAAMGVEPEAWVKDHEAHPFGFTPDYYDPNDWPPSLFWLSPQGTMYEWQPDAEVYLPVGSTSDGVPPDVLGRIMEQVERWAHGDRSIVLDPPLTEVIQNSKRAGLNLYGRKGGAS